jgi:hypothetical protein
MLSLALSNKKIDSAIFGVESNYSANSNIQEYSKPLKPMNQGTQGYRLKKEKNEG